MKRRGGGWEGGWGFMVPDYSSVFFFSFFTHDSPRRAPDKVIQGTEAVRKKQQTVRKIIPISVERDGLQLGAAALTHL